MHNNLNSKPNSDTRIEIIEYNSDWRVQFLAERSILQAALAE